MAEGVFGKQLGAGAAVAAGPHRPFQWLQCVSFLELLLIEERTSVGGQSVGFSEPGLLGAKSLSGTAALSYCYGGCVAAIEQSLSVYRRHPTLECFSYDHDLRDSLAEEQETLPGLNRKELWES